MQQRLPCWLYKASLRKEPLSSLAPDHDFVATYRCRFPKNTIFHQKLLNCQSGANFIELLKHKICLSMKSLPWSNRITNQIFMWCLLLLTCIRPLFAEHNIHKEFWLAYWFYLPRFLVLKQILVLKQLYEIGPWAVPYSVTPISTLTPTRESQRQAVLSGDCGRKSGIGEESASKPNSKSTGLWSSPHFSTAAKLGPRTDGMKSKSTTAISDASETSSTSAGRTKSPTRWSCSRQISPRRHHHA